MPVRWSPKPQPEVRVVHGCRAQPPEKAGLLSAPRCEHVRRRRRARVGQGRAGHRLGRPGHLAARDVGAHRVGGVDVELPVHLSAADHRGQVTGDDGQQLEDGPDVLVWYWSLTWASVARFETRCGDLGAVGGQEGIELLLGRLAVADQGLEVGVGVCAAARSARPGPGEGGQVAVGRLQRLQVGLTVDDQVHRLRLGRRPGR